MNTRVNALTAKDEDYLETIYRIAQECDTVGVTDVAKARDVSVPTVRSAIKRLAENGLVRQEHYGKIMLEDSGRKLGREIYTVHRTLRRFLSDVLLIDPERADEEACLMEHGLSKSTLKRITLFLDAITNCSQGRPGCLAIYRKAIGAK
jgi:DtxR family Mn-dependent transcriptional regulator